ncbi:MAG: Uma2 family endonuclease [Lachnospiraceae bacterium]|nr:Uma2 family endonuclease [Lachnospiraceae bacterium]
MAIEDMQRRKDELKLSLKDLEKLSGVPAPTIQKIFSGTTANPRRATLIALAGVLAEDRYPYEASSVGAVREDPAHPKVIFDRQGTYTIEDYFALPEDIRAELIDGVFYLMANPSADHQLAAGEVYYQVRDFINRNGGNCLPMIAPFGVQLDEDDRTMVEPDLIILCERNRLRRRQYFGAPDFVLEVLSPSNRRHDLVRKLVKYEAAGVREYWILDPMKEKVTVYLFGEETDIMQYDFDTPIPIGIYDGKCTIDLQGLKELLHEIEE